MQFTAELRKALLRSVTRSGLTWSGKAYAPEFYGKFFDLEKLPSNDSRFKNARDDMWQHTVNNDDWTEADILEDPRFSPLQLKNEEFARFVDAALVEESRPAEELERLVQTIRPILAHAGVFVTRHERFGVFEGYKLSGRSESNKLRPAHRMSLINQISSELQHRLRKAILQYTLARSTSRDQRPLMLA